jgi:hypothetical protein
MSTTGAILPTFLLFDPVLRKFDWAAATSANSGTYNIDVTCTINNG